MRAFPIKAGAVYGVRCAGITMTVLASHPCDAILIAIEMLEVA